jgi:hypothetical protein
VTVCRRRTTVCSGQSAAQQAACDTGGRSRQHGGVRAEHRIAMLGCVADNIAGCFKPGGGVPYEKFPRFHEVMAEDSEAASSVGISRERP